jgi:hypothetical protein
MVCHARLLSLTSLMPYKHRNPSEFIQRHHFEDSTSNLTKHVEKCAPSDTTASRQITAFTNGSTYSAPKLRYLLAMWCAWCHRPFSITTNPELVELFQMLYAQVEIPHPITISHDVREIFSICRKKVARVLEVRVCVVTDSIILTSITQDYPGWLHIGVDGWTSPNVFSFLGITVHWVISGRIESFILDFIRWAPSFHWSPHSISV